MADIADIRRRRLEALAANSAGAASQSSAVAVAERAARSAREKMEKQGGAMLAAGLVEETDDSIVPSEFECILCLRCVHLCVMVAQEGCVFLYALGTGPFLRLPHDSCIRIRKHQLLLYHRYKFLPRVARHNPPVTHTEREREREQCRTTRWYARSAALVCFSEGFGQ